MAEPTFAFIADDSLLATAIATALADLGLAAADVDAADLLIAPAARIHPSERVDGDVFASAAGPRRLAYAAGDGDDVRAAYAAGIDVLLPDVTPEALRVRLALAAEAGRAARSLAERTVDEELLKLERDVQIGRNIQLGFLPATLPQLDGWEIEAAFHPAREVAGDFYDAFELINGRRLGFLIADVCDKGVGAALFMALFRTLIRSGAQQNISLGWMDTRSGSVVDDKDWLAGDPSQRRQSLPTIGTGALMNAISGTNDYIVANHIDQGYFATVFFALLDPTNGQLLYVNGGHNPPILRRADGSEELLKSTGPAVGMFAGAKFRIAQARMRPGDTLLLYTDGVPDTRAPDGAFFGMERVHDTLRTAPSAGTLVRSLERQLHEHIAGGAQFDDITMVAVRRNPRSDAGSD
jgi:phosphoserine phosphatase RsbU/P